MCVCGVYVCVCGVCVCVCVCCVLCVCVNIKTEDLKKIKTHAVIRIRNGRLSYKKYTLTRLAGVSVPLHE